MGELKKLEDARGRLAALKARVEQLESELNDEHAEWLEHEQAESDVVERIAAWLEARAQRLGEDAAPGSVVYDEATVIAHLAVAIRSKFGSAK